MKVQRASLSTYSMFQRGGPMICINTLVPSLALRLRLCARDRTPVTCSDCPSRRPPRPITALAKRPKVLGVPRSERKHTDLSLRRPWVELLS